MYPYHNKIKQRIRDGELLYYEFVEVYRGIAPCLLLHFFTEPKIRPIRTHRWDEYAAILGIPKSDIPVKKDEDTTKME